MMLDNPNTRFFDLPDFRSLENMASTENLFTLVDQLQHLETSLITIIFELALKLSSLTSTNIFLLVENSMGRKFAGKPHLCNAYTSHGLKTLSNDIKVQIEPSGRLRESPQHFASQPLIDLSEDLKKVSHNSRQDRFTKLSMDKRNKRPAEKNDVEFQHPDPLKKSRDGGFQDRADDLQDYECE
jgi:hypothetical protein